METWTNLKRFGAKTRNIIFLFENFPWGYEDISWLLRIASFEVYHVPRWTVGTLLKCAQALEHITTFGKNACGIAVKVTKHYIKFSLSAVALSHRRIRNPYSLGRLYRRHHSVMLHVATHWYYCVRGFWFWYLTRTQFIFCLVYNTRSIYFLLIVPVDKVIQSLSLSL